MRRLAGLAICAGFAAAWLLQAAAARAADEQILSYGSEIVVQSNGDLLVRETIDYDFGSASRHGIIRGIPTRFVFDETYDRVTPLDVVSVTASGGASNEYSVEGVGSGVEEIKVGGPDSTITGAHTYVLTYRMEGALNGFSDHDELYWNVTGNAWQVPIRKVTAVVTAPSDITGVACFAGPEYSSLKCGDARHEGSVATFAQEGLQPYEGMTVVVGFEKGGVPAPHPVLAERFSLGRAFALTPVTGTISGSLLAAFVALFGVLVWRTGRDRRYAGGAVAAVYGGTRVETVPLFERDPVPVEFLPPDGIRPGQVGTLIDERANPLDVTATMVDLAVRGYLTIEEIPKEGLFGKPDWRMVRRKPDDDQLSAYERSLLDGLFERGTEVKLSELKAKFAPRMKKVQDALYADAVRRRWFAGRPDKVREKWAGIGWIVLIGSCVAVFWLAKNTHLALIGVPLVGTGLLFIFGARFMPRRTPKGTAMVRRVMGFRRFVESPTQEGMAKMAERENLFSEYLPYAIVFDLVHKWAEAFEALGKEPQTDWYVSPHPFMLAGFAHAMDGFSTVAAGTISSTPASSGSSGFGGGGFSGGGFGGGGGGSW